MGKKDCFRLVFPAGMAVFLLAISGAAAQGEEFRPYKLPNAGQQQMRTQEQQTATDAERVIEESAYAEFRTKTANMTPEKKAELRGHFSKKRDEARGREEYKHYTRLVEILDRK